MEYRKKVTTVREIFSQRETGAYVPKKCLQSLQDTNACTEFYEDGDYYALFEDLSDEQDDDLAKFAVYLKKSGKLQCLLTDCDVALNLHDSKFGQRRFELYQQIALYAGWPANLNELTQPMTWRVLANEIKKIPTEFLDTPAYVYRYEGGGTLANVRGVEPWCTNIDGSVPKPGGPDDNCYYINNGFPGED